MRPQPSQRRKEVNSSRRLVLIQGHDDLTGTIRVHSEFLPADCGMSVKGGAAIPAADIVHPDHHLAAFGTREPDVISCFGVSAFVAIHLLSEVAGDRREPGERN